jgi:peptide/nickel transport system substrate-binding protein
MLMLRRDLLLGGGAAATALGAAGPALAQKPADTLRLAMRSGLPNIDPYYNNIRTGLIMAHHAWDTLVHRDPDSFEIRPLLATAWRFTDPTTLEMELRRGVRFHDGSDFSAEDVVYTLNLVSSPEARVSTPSNYAWIERAEALESHKVRITLKRPTPAALEYLALVVPIYPKAYRERVGADGYVRAPVGAGPYRITRFDPGAAVEFQRFDGYWEGSPKGRPAIAKISVRFVPDATTEMTELLAGRADWIWEINPDQFANVNRMPNLQAVRQESMRIGYLSIDAAGRSGAGNPLTNVKVRQAIFHAIDRKAMAERLVTGGSRVPDAPCYPTQFGCEAEAAVPYEYDPAKAKALLAEAGFPNGFETKIHATRGAIPEVAQFAQIFQADLAKIGVKASIEEVEANQWLSLITESTFPALLGHSYGAADQDPALLFSAHPFGTEKNASRFQSDEYKRLVTAAQAEADWDKRISLYRDVTRLIKDEAFILPLANRVETRALRRHVQGFELDPQAHPKFENVSLA